MFWMSETTADSIMKECAERMEEEIKYDMSIVGIMNDEHERSMIAQNDVVDRCVDIVKDVCIKHGANSSEFKVFPHGPVMAVKVYATQPEIDAFIREHMKPDDHDMYKHLSWLPYKMENGIDNADGTTSITFIGMN